ncbi:hypothetical protein NEOLEDRAFT_1224103, partial [Neolentinus lepideus HHB14362 ss-1]
AAVYAFTDYRAQGQTLPCVITDTVTLPNGRLSLFNLYIALSYIFLNSHNMELLEEEDRLEKLDRVTKEWWEGLLTANA